MTSEEEKQLLADVSAIKKYIGGDKSLGTKGLTHIVEEHTDKILSLENDRAKVIGMATIISLLFTIIGYFVIKLFDIH